MPSSVPSVLRNKNRGRRNVRQTLFTILLTLCRLTVALTFILSGFVKAVDPLGTQYKLNDYLEALGMMQYVPEVFTLVAAVTLAGLEFWLGTNLLFAIHRRWVSRLIMAVMMAFTPFTLWIALVNPVSDCGCFGDAIVLSNWQTFWKNVVLTVAITLVACRPLSMVRFISQSNQWIVSNFSAIFIVSVSWYCLYDLPIFDFRPYHVGADIREGMEIPEGAEQPEFETTFILEKDGERKEFTIDNYPDSTWTFVDSRTEMVSAGYVPPIHDFSIVRAEDAEDITNEVLADTGYTFLLISPSLRDADDSRADMYDLVYEYADDYGYAFYCLTSSNADDIRQWQDITGAEYPFCLTDETTLKTIVRSNPGLLLMRDGKVEAKWSHNRMPTEKMLQAKLGENKQVPGTNKTTAQKIVTILLFFVVPLMLLTVADRLWAWQKWWKEKRDANKIYKLLMLKKKMRKKIVAGNWKMNMNLQEGLALAKELNEALEADKPACDVVICTPFIHLASAAQILNTDIIGLGAENCADKASGAYTGEVSAEMVKSTGAQYVILGHSERREYYNETPEILKEKVLLALANGLKVIFCIGESLAEREADKQNEVVKAELEGSVFNLSEEEFKNIIIAYEPIWAIGTGKTATAEQAEEIHAYIRSVVAEKYGQAVADETSILYGGSCKASNAPELFAKADIDGGLIGGASLKAADFKGIIDAWKK